MKIEISSSAGWSLISGAPGQIGFGRYSRCKQLARVSVTGIVQDLQGFADFDDLAVAVAADDLLTQTADFRCPGLKRVESLR